MLGDVRGRTAVDFGCGSGFYASRLKEAGASRVLGVDLSEAMICELRKAGFAGVVGDAMSIRLGQVFERIVCAGLLEFVDRPTELLRNLRHHAAPEARAAILAPRANVFGRLYCAYHAAHGVQVRLFDVPQLTGLAEDASWRVNQWMYAGPFALAMALSPA